MTETGPPNPYAVRLDDLVSEARVPVDEQVTEQPTGRAPAPEQDEDHRQLRLAGGA